MLQNMALGQGGSGASARGRAKGRKKATVGFPLNTALSSIIHYFSCQRNEIAEYFLYIRHDSVFRFLQDRKPAGNLCPQLRPEVRMRHGDELLRPPAQGLAP